MYTYLYYCKLKEKCCIKRQWSSRLEIPAIQPCHEQLGIRTVRTIRFLVVKRQCNTTARLKKKDGKNINKRDGHSEGPTTQRWIHSDIYTVSDCKKGGSLQQCLQRQISFYFSLERRYCIVQHVCLSTSHTHTYVCEGTRVEMYFLHFRYHICIYLPF